MYIRGMNTLTGELCQHCLPHFLKGGYSKRIEFDKGSILKGKNLTRGLKGQNLPPLRANSFLLDPLPEGFGAQESKPDVTNFGSLAQNG